MAFLHPARHLVMNIGGPADLLAIAPLSDVLSIAANVRTRKTGDVVVVDAGKTWCRKIRQVQWKPSQVDFLLAKAIFPLSSATVLFADHLGGLTEAARVVAGLSRFQPYIEDLLPPSLIVLTTQDCTQDIFNSYVTHELHEIDCIEHPQNGHNRQAMFKHWRSRVRSVQIVQKRPSDSWPDIFKSAHITTEQRWNSGFGLSDGAFQRLCRHAVETHKHDSFSLFLACGIQDQVTDAGQAYLKRFITLLDGVTMEDAEVLASCLAINAYRDDGYVSHPGLVAESLGSRLLKGHAQRNDLVPAIKHHFLQITQGHRDRNVSIVDRHRQLIRGARVELPGCRLCLLKVPACQLPCGHQLCNFCLRVFGSQVCPLCGISCGDQPTSPLVAGVRALGLSGSPGSVLRWLADVREQLPGCIGDFFDIIVCTGECAWLVEDYFVRNVSLPACSRKLKARGTRSLRTRLDRTQNCIAIQTGTRDTVSYSYEDFHARARARKALHALLQRPRGGHASIASTIEREAEIIWQQSPVMEIGCDRHSARDAAQRMFAALFYMEVVSVPAMPTPPFLCQLAVKCRLAYGPHLNAVVRKLSEHSINIYCEVSGTCHRSTLCSATAWQAFSTSTERAFSHAILIRVHSLEEDVRIRIDGLLGNELALDIANSPASLCHLLEKQSSYGTIEVDNDAETVITDFEEDFDNQVAAIYQMIRER